jgi:ribonuclease HI
VKFYWVRGHSDVIENERCDQLAVEASKQDNLSIDQVYEQEGSGNGE